MLTASTTAGTFEERAARADAASAASYLPAGWAPGGTPTNPGSQISADKFVTIEHSECGANSLLLFRVRGSGQSYGTDSLGGWANGAGVRAIKLGWNVRDMQAIYPAPGVPLSSLVKALAGGVATASALLDFKNYRDVAKNSAPAVRQELIDAYNRCPSRKILISGYSQGNIVLRTFLTELPASVQQQIVSTDLVADPTADNKVDASLGRSPLSGGGGALVGVDTWFARRTNPFFKQKTYPSDLARHTYPFCDPDDLACRFRLPAWPSTIANEGKTHASYPWLSLGVTAANRLGQAPKAPPPPTSTVIVTAFSVCPRSDTHATVIDQKTGVLGQACNRDWVSAPFSPGTQVVCSATIRNGAGQEVQLRLWRGGAPLVSTPTGYTLDRAVWYAWMWYEWNPSVPSGQYACEVVVAGSTVATKAFTIS